MPVEIKIDVTKLDKAHFYKGAKGIYATIVLWPNKDGQDQYGNDYMAVQGISKEAKEAGQKGAIVGNGRKFGTDKGAAKSPPKNHPADRGGDDDIPF